MGIKTLFMTSGGKPSPDVGGSNKIIYELFDLSESSDINANYFSFDCFLREINSPPEFKLFNTIGKKLYKNNGVFRRLTSSLTYYKFYLMKKERVVKRIVENNNYDIIHSHHPIPLALLSNFNKPKILTIHNKGSVTFDMQNNDFKIKYSSSTLNYIKSLEVKAIKYADVITFPSLAAKNYYIDDLGEKYFINKDIRIIYNGINQEYIKRRNKDPRILSRYGISIGSPVLLNVANHIKVKHIDKLIKSIRIINADTQRKVVLINVGNGPETCALQQLIYDLNLRNEVILLGNISNDEVLDLMQASNALIMASDKVIFDMVVLEALASDLPLILTKLGGNMEILDEGKNGLFIKNISPESIAKSVIDFLESELFYKSIDKSKLVTNTEMKNNYLKLYNDFT